MPIVPLGGGRFVDTSTGKAPVSNPPAAKKPVAASPQFGSETPWAKAVAAFKPPVTTRVVDTVDKTGSKSGTSSGGSSSVSSESNSPGTGGSAGSSSVQAAAAAASKPDVKPATPDLIQISEESVPVEVMTGLLFENIGGTEILSMSRHDLINGIDIAYQQISNLAKVESTFGGQSLISLQNSTEQIFKSYGLRRYQHVPTITEDPSGLNNHVYLDASGSVIIELSNLQPDMEIEVEFKTADTNDIMY